jgi:hypothetical protein
VITAAALVRFMTENYLTQRRMEGRIDPTRWSALVLGNTRVRKLLAGQGWSRFSVRLEISS